MFARAVQKHRESQPPPKPAPSQPAPTRAQASIQGSFRQPQTVPVSQAPPSHHPVAPPARSYAESQSSQTRDGLVKALNNSSSFQENGSASTNSYQPPLDSMAALHEAVYFDEGDFDDDLDLDFDLSESLIQPSLAAAAARLPSPPPPPVRKPVMAQDTYKPSPAKRSYESVNSTWNVPKSSAPLPWSSSPVEHFKSPKSARVAQPVRQFSPDLPQENEVVDVIPDDARPPKRRTLPWIEGAARDRAKKQTKTESEEVGSARNSATNSTSRRSQRVPAPSTSRSLMSHEKKSQAFPWNQSMRDFKTAQKDLKGKSKTQTRSLMTQGDPEEVEKIKKKNMVPAKLFLSDEQKSVLKLVTEGSKSVFFTGSAGTGKSVLLREVIASLRHKYRKDQDRVAVTASTGLAACNIGGVTLHSFSGIGLGKEPAADLVQKIKKNRKAKERWIRTKVLVIDEISMVDGDLFDKLETIARTLKNNGRPFGGIQLIITGDFFQLPPVPDSGRMSKFAFEADTWNTSIEHTIGLTHVFRQKDPEFAGMLNEMRLGSLSKETIQCFRKLCRPIKYDDGLDATELFPTRGEVDAANNAKMRQLSGSSQVFLAEDGGTIQEKSFRDKLLNNCMAPISIELKINSQVMLIKNIDESLVNGSLGRVVGFMNERTFDILQEDADELDAAINLGSDDEEKELTERRRKIRALAKEKAVGSTTARQWPLVQFSISDGTTRQLLVQPEQWKVELPNGEVQAFRSQIPLILAWALSIHKAQGQTLERVKVDLRKVFEKGQAYVALSRATCQEGLQVLGFEERKVMAHGKVSEFYRSLYSVHEAAAPKANAQSGPKRTTLSSAQNSSESRASYTGSNGRRTANPTPPDLDFSDDEAEAMMAMAEAF